MRLWRKGNYSCNSRLAFQRYARGNCTHNNGITETSLSFARWLSRPGSMKPAAPYSTAQPRSLATPYHQQGPKPAQRALDRLCGADSESARNVVYPIETRWRLFFSSRQLHPRGRLSCSS